MIHLKNILVVLPLPLLFFACVSNKKVSFVNPIHKEFHPEVRSGYGFRIHPILNVKHFYPGLDIVADSLAPIQTVENGIVDSVSRSYGGYGNSVFIKHNDTLMTRYGYLKEIHVEKGDSVRKGEQIGVVGNSGISLARFLFYQVLVNGKAVNPVPFMSRE